MTENRRWKIALDDGLIMRGATRDDADRLSEYNAVTHADPEEHPGPAFWIGEWTRDLLTKPHPTLALDDVIIVEDSKSGQIVSSCVYFQQSWSYCGIPVPFGRPEIVSTHPEYRNRGLIRKQFELMHQWGRERGHLIQGITGIPYYYRQFGYEMALSMPRARSTTVSQLPQWKDDEKSPLRLRKARRSDMHLVKSLTESSRSASLLSPDASEAEIEYQLFDRDERSAVSVAPWIIEDGESNPVGFTSLKVISPLESVTVSMLQFTESPMYREFTQPFLKSLRVLLEELPNGDDKPLKKVSFELFEGHPAHPFLGQEFVPRPRAYAWYVRTPDLAGLLTLIGPKFEERLVGTVFEGFTGEKLLNFYREGLRFKFLSGKLVSVTSERYPERQDAAVNLPDLTFLQMLFGRKSFSEIGELLVDAYANSQQDELLVDTLFPKISSDTFAFAVS